MNAFKNILVSFLMLSLDEIQFKCLNLVIAQYPNADYK
jgi:hypothetical protein